MASKMSGDKRLRRTLRRIEPQTGHEVGDAVERTARDIEANALMFVPVDEGDLARSIFAKRGRDGLTYVIGPGAKSVNISKNPFQRAALGIKSGTQRDRYFQFFKGWWIELGTSRQPARPFMQPAFDLAKRRGLRDIQRAIGVALDKASR